MTTPAPVGDCVVQASDRPSAPAMTVGFNVDVDIDVYVDVVGGYDVNDVVVVGGKVASTVKEGSLDIVGLDIVGVFVDGDVVVGAIAGMRVGDSVVVVMLPSDIVGDGGRTWFCCLNFGGCETSCVPKS